MIKKINKILSDWDPIGVGSPSSRDEYKGYAPAISMLPNDEQKIKDYIIKILNEMGLDYNQNNPSQEKNVNEVVQKILFLKE